MSEFVPDSLQWPLLLCRYSIDGCRRITGDRVLLLLGLGGVMVKRGSARLSGGLISYNLSGGPKNYLGALVFLVYAISAG